MNTLHVHVRKQNPVISYHKWSPRAVSVPLLSNSLAFLQGPCDVPTSVLSLLTRFSHYGVNSGTSQDGENSETWIKLFLTLALLLGDPERWGRFLLWGVFPGWRAGATSPHHIVTWWLAQNLWLLFTPGCSGPTGWSLTVRIGGGSMGIMWFPWKTVMLLEMEHPHVNSHWAAFY